MGELSYEPLAKLHIQLNSNAASSQSNLGDGQTGYLYFKAAYKDYNILSDIMSA